VMKVYEVGRERKSMNLKLEFLHDQFLAMSISASLQHAGIYKDKISDDERNEFRNALRKKLREISTEYDHPVGEARHEDNIELLANRMSDQFGGIFKDGKYRIGLAQKALNLYLKYLWCEEEIPTPPHCPFDRMIIEELLKKKPINWTDMDDIEDYRELVSVAEKKAKGLSLAEWELKTYQTLINK
jgi:hypothetical protein